MYDFYRNMPSPCPYRARMYVSEDLEGKFAYERAFFSYVDFQDYGPKDTVESLTQEFVNEFVWEILSERLFNIASQELNGEKLDSEQIKKNLNFSFKLSISLDFVPNDRIVRRTAALLALRYLRNYEWRSSASCFDVLELLERMGWAHRGWTELLKQASNTYEERHVDRSDPESTVINAQISHKRRDYKAALKLLKEIIDVLKRENKLDEESLETAKKEHGESLFTCMLGLKSPSRWTKV